MRWNDCTNEEKEKIISTGFNWCGADGFICHMSQYKNKNGEVPCEYCPRKKDWDNNGVFELPSEFKLIK